MRHLCTDVCSREHSVCVCACVCVWAWVCVYVQMFIVLEEDEGIVHDQVKVFLWVPVFIRMAQEFSYFIISFAS